MHGKLKLTSVSRSTPAMATALPDLPMPETVMVRLLRIAISSMTDYFEPVFRKIGLSENAFHVLCLLIANDTGSASPSELSELVGTSRANMTRILERLVQEGLVSREFETRDARRHLIQVTAKGRQLTMSNVPNLAEPLRHAFSDLTPDEFAMLGTLLRKAILSFDKGARPEPGNN